MRYGAYLGNDLDTILLCLRAHLMKKLINSILINIEKDYFCWARRQELAHDLTSNRTTATGYKYRVASEIITHQALVEHHLFTSQKIWHLDIPKNSTP